MKQYLRKIKFKKDYRKVFKKDQIIEFQPGMNLLVGNQGSGKSSLMDLFYRVRKDLQDEIYGIDCDLIETLAFDTERDNPRKKGTIESTVQVAMMWSSHGQSILSIMNKIQEAENKLVFVDEPESGLSIKSQHAIIKPFNKAIENGCQMVVATHSIILMKAFENVFDMEKREWINSEKYISNQLSEIEK